MVMSLLSGRNKPKTIEELKEYCESNCFTSEKTRFFIGEDYKKPRAFGIYKDELSGDFIVYKNKDDGNRAVRYKGTDEAFAVGELYDRLQKEIINQKQHYYAGDIPNRSISGLGKKSIFEKRPYKNPYLNMDISSILSGTTGGRLSRTWKKFGGKIAQYIFYIFVVLLVLYGMICNKSDSDSAGSGSHGRDHYYIDYYNNSYDNYSYDNNSYDSGWSSDNWDSGYTDWESDW